MSQQPYKTLLIWQKAIELVDDIYRITAVFPKSELFGLSAQCRRSAVSIPSNIAEGSQRGTDKDFANFILIAKGSLAELQTQMIIAMRQNFVDKKQCENISNKIEELNKMMFSFRRKLTTDN